MAATTITIGEEQRFVPGMRIELRDAEWRIDRVHRPTHGGLLLTCTGHSELVRGTTGKFLTELENGVRILSPETTELVDDPSSGYQASQLYIDTVLRTAPPTDNRIHIGHKAAMDLLPFQLDAALQALEQPRPRILIADAVGLGKTMEAGILISELIRRERGKRILVLAVKSMLAQFQRELWQRFTIPLVRLDSVGLQRVRNNIPANHNPFHYFDRAIISIDTLKQRIDYRDYLEQAFWDIIVIDEAHNVAQRSGSSQRHRLARLLSTRSDALIMLSATPHDGRSESFASLIDMLDPTAIADARNYTHEDYRDKGLVIRRFKQQVASQLAETLPERVVHKRMVKASNSEDAAFTTVREATFKTLDGRGKGTGQLFRTTLEKGLLSSPLACVSMAETRRKKLLGKHENTADVQHDVAALEKVVSACSEIDRQEFSKYQLLLRMLKGDTDESIAWDRTDDHDRIVLFTESIVTLDFLAEHLPRDAKLRKGQIEVLKGTMRDKDLTAIVNNFNRPRSDLRLLLCSDVASEGLNLHHCSHRLIHFDIPWSLMVFQQRNGRIDRYGQRVQPEIHYLMSTASDPKVRGDQRVLEILIGKDEQASKNLGDPSEFMGLSSAAEEESKTAEIIEQDVKDPDDLSHLLDEFLNETRRKVEEGLASFSSGRTPTAHGDLDRVLATPSLIFKKDFDFVTAGLRWLESQRGRALQWSADGQIVDLKAPADLQRRMKFLPREAQPKDQRLLLTDAIAEIQEDMALARDDETDTFGNLQYLWQQHPAFEWLMQTIQDAFGRHAAPVMRLTDVLSTHEHWFLTHGGFPNQRGQALVQSDVAVHVVDDEVTELLPLEQLIPQLKLDGTACPNRGAAHDCSELTLHLDDVVRLVRKHLHSVRQAYEQNSSAPLAAQLENLRVLRAEHEQKLDLRLKGSGRPETFRRAERTREMQHVDRKFAEYQRWLEETQQTEEDPYIQIVAVITGDPGGE